ncbi:MAG TPA: primosomal protein N' [Methylococcaceae bacterium]|nr:primosomal protein N' [Methylococcaceae bacterium]
MTLVLKVAVPFPIRRVFDYLPPEDTQLSGLYPGIRILVPFGRGKTVGYLLEASADSDVASSRLKRALAVLDDSTLLSAVDCRVLSWASRYYHHPIGEVFAAAFPVLLRQGRSASKEAECFLCLSEQGRCMLSPPPGRAPRQAFLMELLKSREQGIPLAELAALDWDWRKPARALVEKGWARFGEIAAPSSALSTCPTAPALQLNAAQQAAVADVDQALGTYRAFLLEGVTGSGKTEVYLRLVARVLDRGEQAMILLPEISLTPQLEARFRARFSVPIVVFHSGLNETERCRAWLAVQRGDAPILLGTRSAVFTPMRRPGLIILDEEHDASFKQQEGFRFSARDVAVRRAQQLQIPVLMGSATPSLESLLNVRRRRYRHLRLPERASASCQPTFRLIDIRAQRLREGLSPALIARIGETLARGEQALLFLNRRGFAPTLTCHACGWVAGCRRCDANLVMHARDRRLRCHHCGYEQALLTACPDCRTQDLRPLGLGTERVEQALAETFPKARVARIDRDSMRRKGSLEKVLGDILAGRIDILLGTQMLAKGHHFPDVTLVGILDVDAGLYSTDFRAGERTAQLIVQVAGRAGRESRPGSVVLQTRHPDHPLLRRLILEGYPGFAAAALEERQEAQLPPFTHQALWRAEAGKAEVPMRLLERIRDLAQELNPGAVNVLGPAPAPMPRQAGRHRCQLLFQCSARGPLHKLVEHLLQRLSELPESKRARWSLDIDPADLY